MKKGVSGRKKILKALLLANESNSQAINARQFSVSKLVLSVDIQVTRCLNVVLFFGLHHDVFQQRLRDR